MLKLMDKSSGSWWIPGFVLPRYLRYLPKMWVARDVMRRDGIVAVCSALESLNRYTKGELSRHADNIYWMKRWMIHYLYTHYPCDVCLLDQKLKCRSCDGSGVHISYYWESGEERDRDWCYRCNGTGVFKHVDIIEFTFSVEGETFTWHQPRDLVSFDVYIPVTKEVYHGEKPSRMADVNERQNFGIYWCILNEFLAKHYHEIHAWTLWTALKWDVGVLWNARKRILPYQYFDFFPRWWRGEWNYFDSDIPF